MQLWLIRLLLLTVCCGVGITANGAGRREDNRQSNTTSERCEINTNLRYKEDNFVLLQNVENENIEAKVTFDDVREHDDPALGENETFDIEYTAAVLEYAAYNDLTNGGLAVLRENGRIFLEYAALAKAEGADIIIFPEYGLTSTRLSGDLDSFLSQTQIVPNVEDAVIPCYYTDVSNYTQVMQELSCGAAELGIYLVVDLAEQVQCSQTSESSESLVQVNNDENIILSKSLEKAAVCPDAGYIFYNTQVVFDRSGAVVARYRKKHLFLEPHFTKGNEPDEEATFVTDFGVTFTLQVCFDIMYEAPAVHNIEKMGIRDVAMSTAWIDELPFLTAPQMWKAWSEGLNVNLVVANYYNPASGELGSGIFRGATSEPATYTYDSNGEGTTLIVGKVKTKSSMVNFTAAETRTRELATTDVLVHHEAIETSAIESGKEENPITTLNKTRHHKTTKASSLHPEEFEILSASPPSLLPTHKEEQNARSQKIGENQYFIHENLTNYYSSVLEKTTSDLLVKTLCHYDGLCCTLNYTYSFNETEAGVYKLFAYSGVVEKGGGVYAMYTQTCAVVFCLTNDTDSCARIEGHEPASSALRVYDLNGTFSSPHVYPSVFTQYLELHDSSAWTFSIDQYPEFYYGSLHCNENIDNLLSMTLFSRWYPMDPK